LEPLVGLSVNFEASKGQAQSPQEEGASHFIPSPKQPVQSNGQDLVHFLFIFYEKQSTVF
jgi:hypothetical protein